MRITFSDERRLKLEAKANCESGFAGIKRWWARKYNLPPNHELFISQSIAGLTLEMFEDLYAQKAEIEETLKNARAGEEQQRLMEKLRDIDNALGEGDVFVDPLIDYWEQELEAGRIPDFDARPEGL